MVEGKLGKQDMDKAPEQLTKTTEGIPQAAIPSASDMSTPVSTKGTPTALSGSQMSFYDDALSDDAPKTTLWMGDLDPFMDENVVKSMWATFGEHVNVKMIRDKFSGMNSGYCFVDFASSEGAAKALMNLQGMLMPGTNKTFKLNWASGGGIVDKKEFVGVEFSIFVGDLGPEVDDAMLLITFQQHYQSCRTAKVVCDAVTGLTRGYGFVRFTDEQDQQMAMVQMQGHLCGNRPMRISMATPKNRFSHMGQWQPQQATTPQYWQGNQVDACNTTVFVGGLTNSYVSEEELAAHFAPYGPITYVKIPPGKGCGFVSFVHRQSAESSIAQLNGCLIGTNRVRLSWGRNSVMSPPPSAGSSSGYPQSQQQSMWRQNSAPMTSRTVPSSPSPYFKADPFKFDQKQWTASLEDGLFDPITRPASAYTSPGQYKSLPSIFGHSAPNSPEALAKSTAPSDMFQPRPKSSSSVFLNDHSIWK